MKSLTYMKPMVSECWKHKDDEEFRKMVSEGFNNPRYLKVERRGDAYFGKTVYEIGAFGNAVGFFAEFLFTLIKLYFAEEKGFVPYVNWQEGFLYLDPEVKEKNGFRYYFDPVSEVTDASEAANVVRARNIHISEMQNERLHTYGYSVTQEYLEALTKMTKKYIRYNEDTKAYLETGYAELIGDKKTLAVHFRGTDYRRQYNNHPVFITIEKEIEKAREVFDRGGYELLFLATDEEGALSAFEKEFGEKLVYFKDVYRAKDGDESVAYSHSNRTAHHYYLGLEVLRDEYVLTRADGLICGTSNLTLSARIMRKAWYEKDYEDLIVLDEGLNHNAKSFADATH
ncbi:MAG: O-fucosyltransferase family protein [Lachnospiraceae bacterium]|nr:O-fucosyltransferase family protein [Lachnospiraceae bacterium]